MKVKYFSYIFVSQGINSVVAEIVFLQLNVGLFLHFFVNPIFRSKVNLPFMLICQAHKPTLLSTYKHMSE